MKKIKLSIFIAVLGLLLVSCARDITEPVMSSSPNKSTLADASFTATFTANNADSLITFSWSAADFGFASSNSYAVQVSPTSDFSSNVITLFTTQNLHGTAKVSEINTIMLGWNYEVGANVTVYYRVSASVTSSVIVYSVARSKSFTPYLATFPMLYVPGAYQGWSPGKEPGVDGTGRLYSYNFTSVYQGIIRIKDGANATSAFKITNLPAWPPATGAIAWGGTLTKTGNNYSGTLNPTGDDFSVSAGTYAIVVNVTALTITLTKTDDWGIIGNAVPTTGWNSSVPMFYNGQIKMWEITTNLVVGEFKFRANDAWTVNLGKDAEGTLKQDGANLAITTAGNYTVSIDPVGLTYKVKRN